MRIEDLSPFCETKEVDVRFVWGFDDFESGESNGRQADVE